MKQAQKEMGTTYLLSALGALVTAFVLAQVYRWLMPNTITESLMLSFMMWLGFVAPVQLTDVLFGRKVVNLFLLNTGYQLVSLLLMAAALFYLG